MPDIRPNADATAASLRFLAVCLILGCALRVVLAALVLSDTSVLNHSDQHGYLALADMLRNTLDFGRAFGAERSPAYPAFLALVQGLTGSTFVAPVVIQNLLGLLAVWACWKLGGLFSRDAANLAAGFAAVNLNMAVYANQMLTESLYLPLMAWCLFLLCRYALGGRTRDLAWLSLGLGASVLVRSASMYLPVFLGPWLVLRPGGGSWRRRAAHGLLFMGLFLAALSPWPLRNLAVYGHAAVTSQGAPHLMGWVVPSVARYEENLDMSAAVAKYTARWEDIKAGLPESVRNDPIALSDKAKDFARDYLLAASSMSVAKAWFWGAMRNLFVPVSVELAYILDMRWSHFSDAPGKGALAQAWNFLARNTNPAYVFLLVAGIVVTLAFRAVQAVGAVALWRRSPRALLALAVVVAYFLAVSGPVGYAKYRLPYEPVFVLLTALAVARLKVFRRTGEGGDA